MGNLIYLIKEHGGVSFVNWNVFKNIFVISHMIGVKKCSVYLENKICCLCFEKLFQGCTVHVQVKHLKYWVVDFRFNMLLSVCE